MICPTMPSHLQMLALSHALHDEQFRATVMQRARDEILREVRRVEATFLPRQGDRKGGSSMDVLLVAIAPRSRPVSPPCSWRDRGARHAAGRRRLPSPGVCSGWSRRSPSCSEATPKRCSGAGFEPRSLRVELDAAAHSSSCRCRPVSQQVYGPFFHRWAERFSQLRFLQQGQVHIYLIYVALTVVLALGWVTLRTWWGAP
jgi:hypothetical protein